MDALVCRLVHIRGAMCSNIHCFRVYQRRVTAEFNAFCVNHIYCSHALFNNWITLLFKRDYSSLQRSHLAWSANTLTLEIRIAAMRFYSANIYNKAHGNMPMIPSILIEPSQDKSSPCHTNKPTILCMALRWKQ